MDGEERRLSVGYGWLMFWAVLEERMRVMGWRPPAPDEYQLEVDSSMNQFFERRGFGEVEVVCNADTVPYRPDALPAPTTNCFVGVEFDAVDAADEDIAVFKPISQLTLPADVHMAIAALMATFITPPTMILMSLL